MTPPYRPIIDPPILCRFPGCSTPVFLDERVHELREWCSDQHMTSAITHHVEHPCRDCQTWPRRKGYKLCSGNICKGPK